MKKQNKALALALKKQRLQHQIALERRQMIVDAQPVSRILSGADWIVENLLWVKDHTPILGGIALACLVFRPLGVVRWGQRLFLGWQIFRRIRRVVPFLLDRSS